MINRAKEIALLSVVGFFLLVLGVAIFGNLAGFLSGVNEVVIAIWHGLIILFFTGLSLSAAYAIVRIRQMSRVREIRPGPHGAVQALIVSEGKGVSRIEQLAAPNMDLAAQIELLLKMQRAMQSDQRLFAPLTKQQTVVQQIEGPKEPSQDELPTNVRYEEVRERVPKGHVLVGIGARGLIDTVAWAVGACVWIVGLSGTGKTSTTVLRVEERRNAGHKFLGVDPHFFKNDSLTNAVKAYADAFLKPMARTAEETNEVLNFFLNTFLARKNGQIAQPWQPITLVVDEVGSLMDYTDALEKENADLLKRIARICGQEARDFQMGGIFISQQATGLAWLRKVALMVIVHQLLMTSEKELACNGDKEVMEDMKRWPRGRTYVYGVGFGAGGARTRQQPYFGGPKTDSPTTYPDGPYVEADSSFLSAQGRNTGPLSMAPTNDLSELESVVPDVLEESPIDEPDLGPNDLAFTAEQEAEFLRLHRKFPQAVKNTLRLMNNGRGLSNRYAKHAGWLLEREGLKG